MNYVVEPVVSLDLLTIGPIPEGDKQPGHSHPCSVCNVFPCYGCGCINV